MPKSAGAAGRNNAPIPGTPKPIHSPQPAAPARGNFALPPRTPSTPRAPASRSRPRHAMAPHATPARVLPPRMPSQTRPSSPSPPTNAPLLRGARRVPPSSRTHPPPGLAASQRHLVDPVNPVHSPVFFAPRRAVVVLSFPNPRPFPIRFSSTSSLRNSVTSLLPQIFFPCLPLGPANT